MKYIQAIIIAVRGFFRPWYVVFENHSGNPFSKKTGRHLLGVAVSLVFISGYVYFFQYRPPTHFPVLAVVTVPQGATVNSAAHLFEANQVVRSATLLQELLLLLHHGESIRAGDYFFDHPLTVTEVATRLVTGDFGLRPIRVTIPEGATSYEIASILSTKLHSFDTATFLSIAQNKEGYLFPDTYYLLPDVSPAQVVDIMETNFYRRVKPLENEIADFGKPLDEVLTMASLLEKEARTPVSRRTIAGILWHRININMPLQVDAVFGYIHATSTYNPKLSDLKVDSLYNTYKYIGLPPGPIANPGLLSIQAAVTPIETNYLFYLTGRDGRMYYSKAYEGHMENKRAYLN